MSHVLEHSVLAVATTPEILSALESLGTVEERVGNSIIFEKDSEPGDMLVVLEGVVFIRESEMDPSEMVIGPGNIIGEIGFFLGTRRTKEAVVGPDGCRIWRISRNLISDGKDPETLILLTHLLMCLGSLVATRLHSMALKNSVYDTLEEKEVTYYCDHDHVAIARLAELLDVDDPDPTRRDWARAVNVWQYIRKIPFRFGKWHVRASVSVPMNGGDQLSKSNLQVALLRSLGLKAGFVRAKVRQDFFQMLQYQDQRLKCAKLEPRNLAEYHFCAVALDGRWVHCDASFPRDVVKLLGEQVPSIIPISQEKFARDKPFSLIDALGGEIDEISDDLKVTVFAEESLESMESRNILLDRIQSFPFQVPEWVRSVRRLLVRDPLQAYLHAYGSLVYDLKRFHQMIRINLDEES